MYLIDQVQNKISTVKVVKVYVILEHPSYEQIRKRALLFVLVVENVEGLCNENYVINNV